MTTARGQHSATLLPDGRVLVAGGLQTQGGSVTALAEAEIYSPAAGSWAPAGQMAAGRYAHTATALSNGRVLVAGGENQGGTALGTVELYDPATNHWGTVAPLHTARFGHAAVLLTSGRVLIVGGRTSADGTSTPLASTEIYDPGSDAWAAGPSLSVARSDLTATLLRDGRVLVAGGDGTAGNGPYSPQLAAEIIDPQGGTATRTASMGTARAGHTASLLADGRVLVVGGTPGTRSAEVFTPATGTWAAVAAPRAARRYHTAALLPSGMVLVAGGADAAALDGTELYDPRANTWSPGPPMSTPRLYHTATTLTGEQVLVTGGIPVFASGTAPLASAELYTSPPAR